VIKCRQQPGARALTVRSTGVLPFLMTYLGPRTAEAGFIARMPPVTIQSNIIADRGQMLFDRWLR